MALLKGLIVFCVGFLMIHNSVVGAIEFRVGGAKGWTVPTSDSHAASYNQWAEMNRFQVGDSLLFVYKPDNDLVMQVSKEDYASCNTATPIATYSDGKTTFTFKESGPHYFISGIKDNCLKNEKLVVIVMANRNSPSPGSNQTSPVPPAPAPAPAPSGSNQTSPVSPAPAPAPSGSIEIVPAPVGMETPSQSPSGATVSSAPAGQHSPASSSPSPMKFASVIVIIGAIVGSSLFLDL